MTPSRRPSRTHKILLSSATIVVSLVYALQNTAATTYTASSAPAKTSGETSSLKVANEALQQTLATLITQTPVETASPKEQAPAPATNTPAPVQTPAPKSIGQYANGSYTGSSIDAYYGTVQIEAIIKGGKIADVQFLQYPHTHSNSQFINSQAMPLLTQEAIQAQIANVSGVSGATFTSEAFIQSLSSALAQAKA